MKRFVERDRARRTARAQLQHNATPTAHAATLSALLQKRAVCYEKNSDSRRSGKCDAGNIVDCCKQPGALGPLVDTRASEKQFLMARQSHGTRKSPLTITQPPTHTRARLCKPAARQTRLTGHRQLSSRFTVFLASHAPLLRPACVACATQCATSSRTTASTCTCTADRATAAGWTRNR